MGTLISLSVSLLCVLRLFAPEDAHSHQLLLCLEEHVCVCVAEAFVPSVGQARSDRQWWEDLGVGGYGRGLTMKA